MAIPASMADAAATRAEYVAQVDPICQDLDAQSTSALRRRGLKPVIDLGDLLFGERRAQLRVATQLTITNKFVARGSTQIAAIPPAPGDEAVISDWLADVRAYLGKANKAVKAIRGEKPRRGYRLFLSGARPVLQDNDALVALGFQYCASPS